MRFVAKTAYSGILSFTLSELIEEYYKPKDVEYSGRVPSYICFLLDDLGSKFFIRSDGEKNTSCLDDSAITVQFRAEWYRRVLGCEVDTGGDTIENWNKGTRYSVENYGWESLEEYTDGCGLYRRREYRLAMMRDVLEREGDMEFSIEVWVHSGLRKFFD